jgi:TRAP-type C4-dicarboxylate transport system permease small subunit
MRLGRLGSQVERGIHKSSRGINYLALLVLFLMMLLVAFDVLGRYIFNSPFTGTFDSIEMMMVVVVFCSLAYCTSEEAHVRVDIILGRLSQRTRAILNIVTFIPSIFIVALITWRLGNRSWSVLQDLPGPVTPTIHIPHWPLIILATLGSFIFLLELIIFLFRSVKQVRKTKNHTD